MQTPPEPLRSRTTDPGHSMGTMRWRRGSFGALIRQSCEPILGACLSSAYPQPATRFPTGPDWLHQIKYDGCRLRVDGRGAARDYLAGSSRSMRAGFPTAKQFGGMLLVTTLPAPTAAWSPMDTPGRMMTQEPIQTRSPIMIGADGVGTSCCSTPCSLLSSNLR